MIRYTLKCSNDHRFDSWFRSADAFEALMKSSRITCPECGSGQVDKALMAPQVRPGRKQPSAASEAPPVPATEAPPPAPAPLSAPANVREARIAEFRKLLETKSEYVGLRFAAEARKIHSGESPGRMIHGEAKPEEARALLEEGVPVAPLPFLPARKVN